jgi:hypothetical protein
MSATTEEKVEPVKPERLHLALGIYQSALVATEENNSDDTAAPGAAASRRAILALKREFPEAGEFQSMSVRLQHFTEVLGDKKLIKWGMVTHSEGGLEIHDAVVNALATAPFRKSGVLDKVAFHALVKAEYTRLESEEKK